MVRRDFIPIKSLGENAGGIERVKEIQVYAERQGTNVFLKSGFIEL